ncbi:hypothetical protein PLESTF_000390500 [Pleodorina starrii]|nr:hypothetical protein PLESTF_000390500 [Pleodorina starrii]
MREASTAAAAAAASAATASAGGKNGQGAAGQADNVSSDSDPESVSSGSQDDADGRRDGGRRQRRRSQQPEEPQQPPGDGRPAHGGGARSAQAGPMGHDGGPPGPQPRAMSASHTSPQKTTATTTTQQQQQPSRPGQLTLVASSAKQPQAAAAASPPPRSAWPAAAAAVTAPPATDDNAPQRQQRQRDQEAKTVSSESSDSGANDDSDVESASDVAETPGKRSRLGGAREAKGRPHPVLQQRGTGEEDEEEARQRAIAAAAAAAIQGRSAADASALVGSANQLARAVISDGPMKVDRWSDWDLADSSDSLSAWATHQDGDPVRGGHLRAPRPVGHLAPPESLVTGPAGAHALPLPQPPAQQRGLGPEAGAAGGSRQGSRGSDGVAAPRAGSAPHSGDGRRRGGSGGGGGGGGGQSDDDDGGANESAAARRGGGSHATTSPPPPVPSFPRSGVVPAGTKATALANGPVAAAVAAAAAASGAAASSARRPPQGPATSPPQSAGRSGGASSGGANGAAALPLPRGASSGNLACASASTAAATSSSTSSPAASETAAVAAAAAPPYLQYYGAFHEILTLCYSSLPVMLDAAALSSASVATVAGTGGGGGGGSRPASRMMLGSAAAAVAASGFDLLERYANLLARCEAWQTKLHQLSSAMPEDDGPSPSPAAAAAPPSPHPSWTSGSGPAAAASAGAGPSPQQQQQQQRTLPAAATSPQTRRYVAITDDTAHPEVRNVVVAALRLLSPGWVLDPADQVTEPAKPDASADDDAAAGGGGSTCNSRPPTALAGGAAATPPRAVTPVGFGGSGQGPGSGQGSGSSGGGGGGTGGTSSGGGAAAAASAGGGGSRCHVWNVLWSWSVKVRVPVSELLVWQRVNHFSEARQLTRKDLLKKHLAKYQAMHNTGRSAALFDRLTPTTFVLPKEAAAFEEAYVRALHGVEATCVQPVGLNLWIQKPVGLSRGRGISLLTSLKQVNTAEAMVVQRYLTNPLLVEGHKFDLRLYVLVTSFNPLEAWMYDEGFARFTTLPYTLDEAELGNMHVHLTNSSVQRSRAEAGQLPAFLQTAEPAGGSKTSLATLRRLLSRHGVDWPLLWSRVCEVATATLFAAQDAIPHSPNSFELFGFDMMIDAELKVWLLEVNSSPSMGLDTPLDQAVKPRLIADVLELLAPLPFDRAALAGVLRARTNTSRSGRRGTQGLLSGTVSEERELCCADLQAVLGGALPRRYGERPRSTGGFTTCLAPSAFHDRLLKLRRPLP